MALEGLSGLITCGILSVRLVGTGIEEVSGWTVRTVGRQWRSFGTAIISKKQIDTHPYHGPGNVVIDVCIDCGLIWLDYGELGTIIDAPGRDRER